MAVKLEFVNMIIPIEKINQSTFDGGFEALVEKYKHVIGRAVWFDEHLFRMGWMDTWMVDGMIAFWEEHGLVPVKKIGKENHWNDLFVISSGLTTTVSNCDWIEVDFQLNIAWLKGTKPETFYPNYMNPSYNYTYGKG